MGQDGKAIISTISTERDVGLCDHFKRFIERKLGGEVTIDSHIAEGNISIGFTLRSGIRGRRDFPLDDTQPLARALLQAFAAIELDIAQYMGGCVLETYTHSPILDNVVQLGQVRQLRRAVDPIYRRLAVDLAATLDQLANQIESLNKSDPDAARRLATRVQDLSSSADRVAVALKNARPVEELPAQ